MNKYIVKLVSSPTPIKIQAANFNVQATGMGIATVQFFDKDATALALFTNVTQVTVELPSDSL